MSPQDSANLTFLALTIWREARGESQQAQLAVAYVICNRAAHGGWWGSNVQDVVFKKWQFSSLTDPHDPQLTNWPSAEDKVWAQCLAVAEAALTKSQPDPSHGSDSYFDISIVPPPWAHSADLQAVIGRLHFFRTVAVPVAVPAPKKATGSLAGTIVKLNAPLNITPKA